MLHNSPKAHFTYLTRNLLNLWLVWQASCCRMLLYVGVNVSLTHCAIRKMKGWRGGGGGKEKMTSTILQICNASPIACELMLLCPLTANPVSSFLSLPLSFSHSRIYSLPSFWRQIIHSATLINSFSFFSFTYSFHLLLSNSSSSCLIMSLRNLTCLVSQPSLMTLSSNSLSPSVLLYVIRMYGSSHSPTVSRA